MFQTMTQIGRQYGIDAKTVGRILYDLKIRDPQQKGFPFEQAITHGIAKAFTGRSGDIYYRYDIERIREEFEAAVKEAGGEKEKEKVMQKTANTSGGVERKLRQMLDTLNGVLETGEIEGIYRLKADIADLYAHLGTRTAVQPS